MIRDRALQKLTQGTQMAETIGQVKGKIMEDVKFKFETFKSTIKTLENVIDTNSKLIKDLTEAVYDKNLQN
jgi:chaperonin cofactor prefoldin